MKENVQQTRNINGKIGELLVELELTKLGWHVERLDGSTKAVNGDLIAIRGPAKYVVQVKSNGSQINRAFLGHAGQFLENNKHFFNGKDSPIQTDFVVSVSSVNINPVFHVFTVKEAEEYAQNSAKSWYGVLTKAGNLRSANFPVSPKHDELIPFLNAWHKML